VFRWEKEGKKKEGRQPFIQISCVEIGRDHYCWRYAPSFFFSSFFQEKYGTTHPRHAP
jgi:hypothetical protein